MDGGALAAVPQTGGLCRCLLLLSIYRVKVIALETPDLLTVRDEGRLVRICTEETPVSRQTGGGEKSAGTQRQWFHTGLVYDGLGETDGPSTWTSSGWPGGGVGGGMGSADFNSPLAGWSWFQGAAFSLFLSTLGWPSLFVSSSSCVHLSQSSWEGGHRGVP